MQTFNVPQASSAAERNREPICAALCRLLAGSEGCLLEVAAGAGVHAAWCAPRLPLLRWQPTDLLDEGLPVIDAACASVPSVLSARQLDLTEAGSWAPLLPALRPVAAVLAVNVTHISPWAATLGLLRLASEALSDGGLLIVYGPFRVGGECRPESNAAFDASLRQRNPAWGYRDVEEVERAAEAAGLRAEERLEMPANNWLLALRKGGRL